jgi:hypothetical protein
VTDLATRRATERAERIGVPEIPDPPPVPGEGVELTRLLALARLTPQQAAVLGSGVLAEATRQAAPAADPAPVAALLAEIAAAARFPGRRPDPAGDELLAALDRVVAELPHVGVAAAALRLAEATTGIDRDAVRTELAALARAVPAGVGGGGGPRPAGARPTAVRAAPTGRVAPWETRNPGRRIAAWVLSFVVLAAVVLVEVVVLRGKITTDIGLLLQAGRGGGTPSATSTPDGLPVRAPAPAAAGSVTGVDLRPLAPCAPGTSCTLRLLVRLAPRAEPQVVTWSYLVVDRCTGTTASAPGGTVTVSPNGQRAVAVGTVAVPDLPAVAVVAVTDHPATAASAPVSFGSCRATG